MFKHSVSVRRMDYFFVHELSKPARLKLINIQTEYKFLIHQVCLYSIDFFVLPLDALKRILLAFASRLKQ